MRVSEKLKGVLLGDIRTANSKAFLIPGPCKPFRSKLITYMHICVTCAGFHSSIAGCKEWINRGRIVIVISRDQIKLIGWSVAHDGREKIVCTSKLLCPAP